MVEPATPFVPGWHIQAICEHLEAVTWHLHPNPPPGKKTIRDLLVTVPPGCTKSLTVCVFWPAWAWGPAGMPWMRWLFSSYSLSLVCRDAAKSRLLMDSAWYQERWGHTFRFRTKAVTEYDNDRTGGRIGVSVGAGTTGEKGDILAIDDPHNVTEVESDTVRKGTIQWWDEAFYNRSNDLQRGPHVVIGQRTHWDDLQGHLIEQGGEDLVWLNIPEEFEADQKCRTPLWTDPRTREGELMRPERFGPREVKKTQKRLGLYGYAAQHQQRPTPRSGGTFQRQWFKVIEAPPAGLSTLRYWDKAASSKAGDYSAGVKIGRDERGFFYVLDVLRGQWSAHERNQVIRTTAALDGIDCEVWVEQEGGASGKESAELSIRELAGFNAHAEAIGTNKEVRAQPFSAQCEAGNVFLVKNPRRDWIPEYIDELCVFPLGKHDDQVDASSGAFNKIALGALDWEFGAGGGSVLEGSAILNAPSGVFLS